MKTRLVLLLASCFAGALWAAELTNESASETTVDDNAYYRWIDGDGRVQYTDFEPVGTPSQRVELTPEIDSDSTTLLQSSDNAMQPDSFHDQHDQILPIEHIGPCADARQQLAVLHSELPVYESGTGHYRTAWRGDAYRGERRYLEAEERMAAIGAARSQVLHACSDPDAFQAEEEAFKDRVQEG